MPEHNLYQMLQNLQKMQKKEKDTENLQGMYDHLKELKQTFLLALLYQEIQGISSMNISDADLQEGAPKKESFLGPETIQFLQDHTDVTSRRNPNDPGQTDYLLSRPTGNYEYQKGAAKTTSFNKYKNTEQTEWFVETNAARLNQFDENPVISCWIPERSIAGTSTPHENTGTLGELGENPFGEHIVVLVDPGEYEVYSELKENSGHARTKQSLEHQRQEGHRDD